MTKIKSVFAVGMPRFNLRAIFLWFVLLGLVFLFARGCLSSVSIAKQSACMGRLHQIRRALLAYHEDHGRFPPAFLADANGVPRQSWRVLLLPYLSYDELYAQYHINESWDSANNRALLSYIPLEYQCPAAHDDIRSGYTNYVLLTGSDTAFSSITGDSALVVDGLENTLMVVEVANARIPWTAPVDLTSDTMSLTVDAEGGYSISSNHPSGPSVLFMDGTKATLHPGLSTSDLKSLVTPNGRESITREMLQQQGKIQLQ